MGNLSSRSGTQKLRNRAPNVSQFDILVEKIPTLEKVFQAYLQSKPCPHRAQEPSRFPRALCQKLKQA